VTAGFLFPVCFEGENMDFLSLQLVRGTDMRKSDTSKNWVLVVAVCLGECSSSSDRRWCDAVAVVDPA
jgi:hypothetical protein